MSGVFDEAGAALHRAPLYVHPGARSQLASGGNVFDGDAEAAIVDALDDVPNTFIAVLPMEAKQRSALDEVRRSAGLPGTYLVMFPDGQYLTGSDELSPAQVREAAAAAFDGATTPEAFFRGFVARVESLQEGDAEPRGSGGSGYLPLGILLAAGGGGLLLYRRNKRQREKTELSQVRVALDEDITAYGEELAALDLDVRSDAVPAEARDDYARALDLYEHAKSAADRAERPGHLRPVTSSLEEGRWLLSCVRARVDGEGVPDRRPPCFFDPRHGPSVVDVSWAPPGGVARNVPACQADAVRLRQGEAPDSRLVTVNGESRPYWEAGPAYAAWAGGYYGGFLPGILWGTMLGSTFAHGPAYGDTYGGGFDGGFDGGGGFEGGFDGGGFGGFEGGF